MKNYCVLCGAFKAGRTAMQEHFDTDHAPDNTDYGAVSPYGLHDQLGYVPSSAIEEFGGED